MKKPQKISMSNIDTKIKEPTKIPMPSTLKQELFDDFGYVTTIETQNNHEDNQNSN
jgi:hypothetical protein